MITGYYLLDILLIFVIIWVIVFALNKKFSWSKNSKEFQSFYYIISVITAILLLFTIGTLVPGSGRWSTGHYLIVTSNNNKIHAYALHGENVITTPYRSYLNLKDSIQIEKADIIGEYHTKGLHSKGWKDSDFLYDYLYNYCVYQKQLGENFIVLEDNKLEIGPDCSTDLSFYIELQELEEEFHNRN